MSTTSLCRDDRVLLATFIDDADALSTTEMDRLIFRCREDGAFLQAVARVVDDASMLDRLLSDDSVAFADRVMGAVTQAEPSDRFTVPPARRRWSGWLLAVAGLLLMTAPAIWLLNDQPTTFGWTCDGAPIALTASNSHVTDSTRVWQHHDGTTLTIGAGATVRVGDNSIALEQGQMAVVASKRAVDDPLDFHLPDATARILGTAFTLSADEDGSTLRVTEGAVAFSHARSSTTITATAGQTITANRHSTAFSQTQAPDVTITVQGRPTTIRNTTHDRGQDKDGWARSIADGAGVELTGNTWKFYDLRYTVTANTVLEFDYQGDLTSEIHLIGLTTQASGGNGINRQLIRLAGSQDFGLPPTLLERVGPHRYRVPAGTFPAGPIGYLLIASDDDKQHGSLARFANISISER